MNRYFADISNNNTQPMNFEAYRKEGQHVLLGHKATEGTGFVDQYHADRSERAHKAGSWVLHYHFGHVGSSVGSQVQLFWNTIRGHMARLDIPCLDIEGGGLDGHGAQSAAQWVNDFARTFTKVSGGHHIVGYCNESLLQELARERVSIVGDRWWIAAYGQNMPHVAGLKTWAWQFTNGEIGPTPHQCVGIGRCDVSSLNWATYLRLRMSRPPR